MKGIKWLKVRYATTCAYCNKSIPCNNYALWFPDDKAFACRQCVSDHDLEEEIEA